jgi:hypothetical protein
LGTHIGVTIVLLFAAAVLLAQVFTQRWWAIIGTLVVVFLFTAGLDRLAYASFRDRARDGNAPLAARIDACENMSRTFFYRESMRESLDLLRKDEQAPAALQYCATKELGKLPRKP